MKWNVVAGFRRKAVSYRQKVQDAGHKEKSISNYMQNIMSINIDIAAKRRKKHKNKILGLVISMSYNE